MPIDLASKPIVITGASSGIGRATAIACAEAGMPVAVMARRTDRLDALVQAIRSRGGRAICLAGSVEDVNACRRLVERCRQEFGSVYAVFANAGYAIEQPVLSMSDQAVRAMFEVNFFGSLNIIRPASEIMRAQGQGHVLWCSSCLSKISLPRYAAYCATKAAQDHFARSMRLELRASGIAVSSIHPVGTRTELFDGIEHNSPGGASLIDRSRNTCAHSPERVARAVVRCLRRPRGEVWLSTSTRILIAFGVALPGLADVVIDRLARRRIARQGAGSSADSSPGAGGGSFGPG
ncbi:MAG: SDR family oxidoreductase [Phycisphaerales bacterium]